MAFAVGTYDRKAIDWQAMITGISGVMMCCVMLACVEQRSGKRPGILPCAAGGG